MHRCLETSTTWRVRIASLNNTLRAQPAIRAGVEDRRSLVELILDGVCMASDRRVFRRETQRAPAANLPPSPLPPPGLTGAARNAPPPRSAALGSSTTRRRCSRARSARSASTRRRVRRVVRVARRGADGSAPRRNARHELVEGGTTTLFAHALRSERLDGPVVLSRARARGAARPRIVNLA